MEVKEKPPTLTLVTLNDNSVEVVDMNQIVAVLGPLAQDESHPDLPIELSEHTISPDDFTMVVAMSGIPVLFVDACWIQEVSAEIWNRAENRY